jgi:hypothetical protein
MFLGTGLLTGSVAIASTMAGCQSNTTSSSTTTSSGGGSSTTSGTGGNTTGTGGNATGTGGNTTGTGGDTTGTGGTMVEETTIKDITTNKVGPGLKVKLSGVVAMSQKFLVSKGSASGSCLWGVFVSAPNLTTTEPNSGILVVNYGDNATIDDGGSQAFCPRLGIDPIGDKIPDDTKPGDVLDVIGETSYFLLPNCASQAGGSTVAEFQIAKGSSVTKTGTATPPAPYVLSKAEIDQAADQNDQAFHDKWGGVKVAVANVVSEPQSDGMGGMAITDSFGHLLVHDKTIAAPTAANKLQVGDKLYYRGYLANSNACYDGPVYANPITELTHIEGFVYLDFCTWNLQPNDKCADLSPSSDDCTSAAMCAQ